MNGELKFYLITDTHHYAVKDLGYSEHQDQKCLNETGAILDAAFEKFAAQSEIDIVLIAGDLSNNGEMASHLELIEKLNKLQQAGKRVYLITATHDYTYRPDGEQEGKTAVSEGGTSRAMLRGLYEAFGFREAIAEYPGDNLSYVVQLAPGYRLLCLNDDGNGRSYCGYDDSHLAWILDQIKAARESGNYIFAMSHHPVLPPSPIYPVFSKRDMLGDYEKMSTVFADAYLEFIFTGHSHMQNIGCKTTEKGNTIWDINTGSLAGYPTPIRKVTLNANALTVKTEKLDSFDWDFQGKDPQEYLRDRFDFLINDIFDSMAYNFDHFADLAGGFSMDRKTAYKLKTPIKLAGKFMQKLTLGKAGQLLFIRRKIDKSVRGLLIKDLLVEIVRNVFAGTEHYSPDTPEYRAVMAITARLAPLVRRLAKGADFARDLPGFVAQIIYDDTPDNDAALPVSHPV